MLMRHSSGGFAVTSAPEGFELKDFEEAGLRAVERKFGPKDVIFTPGDPDDQLYFLLSGTVRLYKIYGDYKEATTALLKEGGIFGKLSLAEGRWQDVFAETVTEARVASIQKSAIERVIKSRPDFALKLFSSFSERMRQSDEVIESLLHREVSTRLATLLINLSDRFGQDRWGGPGAGRALDAPGSGEHDRLHPRGRLEGHERVSAGRQHRNQEPQNRRAQQGRPRRILQPLGPLRRRPVDHIDL